MTPDEREIFVHSLKNIAQKTKGIEQLQLGIKRGMDEMMYKLFKIKASKEIIDGKSWMAEDIQR